MYKKRERELNNLGTIAKNPVDLSRLDSSIKKNSAFVKKLKNLTDSTRDTVLKDISTLNISKYLTEVVAALVELKLKASEIPMYLEICSKIHRMYPEFPGLFLEQWQKGLPKCMQEITNYSKLRNDLRIFSELILIGIFSLKDSLQMLGNLLKLLLSEKQSVNLNVVLNFCKNCGWDYAGLVPRRLIVLAHKHKEQIPSSSFLSTERQKGLRMLLKDYYAQICKQIVADHRALKKRELENKQVLITRGELSEKKKNIYEENKANFQKLWSSVQQFGELLNEDLPELKNDDPDDDLDKQTLLNIDSSGIKINSIDVPLWDDDNLKAFYEQLPNLKNEIPAHLYKDSIKEKYQKSKKEENKQEKMDRLENKELFEKIEQEKQELEKQQQQETSSKPTATTTELSDEALAKNLTKELINESDEDESDNIENALDKLQLDSDDEDSKTNKKSSAATNGKPSSTIATPITTNKEVMKVTLDELLNMLLNCVTKDTIDKAAYNFCLNFNTKSNRKKLIRALFTCPRTRLDLLPFFARFVAIINPIMPLVGADLVYLLKKDFRFHLNKKDQINIESKIKTVRYVGELTKFGVFPKDETMQCLKILILDFSHHQIEMACNLLEVCGRYLYLSPSTHIKCNLLLQQMLRKKSLIPIQTKYISMIENAYYNSCPNLQTAGGQLIQNELRQQELEEPLSDVQLYFKHLIQKELDRKSLDKVLNLIRRFDYTDKEFVSFAVKCLSEIWLIKYFNIKYLANCLSALSQYQPVVGHQVVDCILEEMRLMIEINSIKYNQRRTAVVRYLGELYNYRLIDSSIVVNALYLLISYGVNPNYELFDLALKEKASKLTANEQTTSSNKAENSSTLKRSKSLTDLQEINEQLMEYGESELDAADNLIRIRLICLLLDTCVPYINTASGKRKLECFILFFQLYFYRKKIIYILNEEKDDAVFPVDIEFAFVDSVRKVKPKFKFSKNYNDAFIEMRRLIEKLVPRIEKLMPKNKPTTLSNLKAIAEIDEEEDDDSDVEGETDEELEDEELDDDQSDEEDLNNQSQESADDQEAFDDFEDEFQREFDQVMSESLLARSNENVRNMNTDIVIPISKLNSLNMANDKPTAPLISLNSNQPITSALKPPEEKTLKVVVMTKSKNNKQILKPVQVPLDCDFAKSLKEKAQAEQEEKERVSDWICWIFDIVY